MLSPNRRQEWGGGDWEGGVFALARFYWAELVQFSFTVSCGVVFGPECTEQSTGRASGCLVG